MNPITPAVQLFARHRNAANLLFFSMIMLGFFGLTNLNIQFFPTTEIKNVNITVPWPGATAQDIDKNIVATVQPEVRFIDGVKEFSSTSRQGVAVMNVEFYAETDMQRAVGDVEAAVNALTTLPKESERPIISQETFSNRLHRSLSPGRLKNALCVPSQNRYATACWNGASTRSIWKVIATRKSGSRPTPPSCAATL